MKLRRQLTGREEWNKKFQEATTWNAEFLIEFSFEIPTSERRRRRENDFNHHVIFNVQFNRVSATDSGIIHGNPCRPLQERSSRYENRADTLWTPSRTRPADGEFQVPEACRSIPCRSIRHPAHQRQSVSQMTFVLTRI